MSLSRTQSSTATWMIVPPGSLPPTMLEEVVKQGPGLDARRKR
jgi:hypothetical protein